MHKDATKILIVEDERKIADTLQQGLTEQHYAVEVAYDGYEGRTKVEQTDYNLVILDINLPGVSGYELCRQIRSRNSGVPVVMLTALNSIADKIEGFDAGADDYVVKPFDFTELLARMKALLRRSHTVQQAHLLRVADLVMNLENREVTRSGRPITLTAKEFQLLEYFVKNKNKLVSRSDIALHVWEIDFDTKTNVIDVYVNFLRKKLDVGNAPKLIHTQIGQGYILKDSAA